MYVLLCMYCSILVLCVQLIFNCIVVHKAYIDFIFSSDFMDHTCIIADS